MNKSIFNISPSEEEDYEDSIESDEKQELREAMESLLDRQIKDEEETVNTINKMDLYTANPFASTQAANPQPSYVSGTPRTSYTPPVQPTFGARPYYQSGYNSYTPPYYGNTYQTSGYNTFDPFAGPPEMRYTGEEIILDRRKKIIFCDFMNIIVESYNPPSPPRGAYDLRPKVQVWKKLQCFNPDYIFVIGNEYFSKGSEEEFVLISETEYWVSTALNQFLQLPLGHCMCKFGAINGNPEFIKPNIGLMTKTLEMLPKEYSKTEILVIGTRSGIQGQNNRDLEMAQRFGCDYIGIEQLLAAN